MEDGISVPLVVSTVVILFFIFTFSKDRRKNGDFKDWNQKDTKNSDAATYESFDGFVSIPLRIKESRDKTFTYKLNAEEGSLKLVIKHPDHTEDEIVSCTGETIEGTKDFHFPSEGKYRLRISGAKTKGSFSVEWT